ncbi:MAG TPA: adenylate kinase [Candidatus Dormibacteraeota bacterium]|jgi:adenylate kinase|nr:adenylate kinase [Candidatus Dormibacteraeota bacterium]
MIGLIFGPPGSGKGTQAGRIEREFGMAHLSTGEILRSEAAHGSAVGKEAAQIMAAGDLVPDDLIDRIVESRLRRIGPSENVLLDGFPRTIEQAKALDRMVARQGRDVDFVVALDVPEPLLVDRLLHRAAVEGRADDTRQAIMERMHEYRTRTAAVLDHYRQRGVPVVEVNGVGGVDEVFDKVRGAIKRVTGGI